MTRALFVGIWVLTAAGCLAVTRAAFFPVLTVELGEQHGQPQVARVSAKPYNADSLASVTIRQDPFRAARRPAAAAYDPAIGAPGAPAAPAKPLLTLVGLVAGPEPSAVVEGIPGVDGARALRVGDSVGGFTIRRITTDRVVIAGMDTTWVLNVREPWR